jgi:hypothetical protein
VHQNTSKNALPFSQVVEGGMMGERREGLSSGFRKINSMDIGRQFCSHMETNVNI